MAKNEQLDVPGTPAPVDPIPALQAELNRSVLAVASAESALRVARARERAARIALARQQG